MSLGYGEGYVKQYLHIVQLTAHKEKFLRHHQQLRLIHKIYNGGHKTRWCYTILRHLSDWHQTESYPLECIGSPHIHIGT